MINSILIRKTAKYAIFGNPNKADTIIFTLHGYGQLADFFIRKFNVLDKDKYFIVAPEGLHRFYLKGSSGRVGASWMTKEKRLEDINDYIIYLNELWKQLSNQFTFNHKILLGFSQGGATASRWHCLGNFKADIFILWAAIFPQDMEKDYCNNFNHSKNYFVFGDEDEYYNQGEVEKHYLTLKRQFDFELVKFKGNHNICSKTLLNLLR
jgi:predicted esterase